MGVAFTNPTSMHSTKPSCIRGFSRVWPGRLAASRKREIHWTSLNPSMWGVAAFTQQNDAANKCSLQLPKPPNIEVEKDRGTCMSFFIRSFSAQKTRHWQHCMLNKAIGGHAISCNFIMCHLSPNPTAPQGREYQNVPPTLYNTPSFRNWPSLGGKTCRGC